MARLPTAIDLAGRTPQAGRPLLNYGTDPIGAALQGLGQTAMRIGRAGMEQANEDALRDEKFGAQTRFLQFEQNWRKGAIDRAENAPPGAAGFTDNLRTDYTKGAKEFFGTIPDHLKPEYDLRLADLEGKLTENADSFASKERDRYALEQTDTGLNALLDRQRADPSNPEAIKREGESLYDNSGIPPILADEKKREWRRNAATALFEVRKATNPDEAERLIGAAPSAVPGGRHEAGAYDRASQVQSRLMSKGWSPQAAAAIAGGLIQESGARSDGPSGDSGTAQGMAQWRGDRLDNLKAFATSQDKDWHDFNTQVDFIDWELRNTESGAGKALMSATTVDQAAEAAIGYERPQGWSPDNPRGGHGWQNRQAAAQRLAGDAPAPEYADIPFEDRQNLYEKSIREQLTIDRSTHALEVEQEREQREAVTKTGYDMMLADDLATPDQPKQLTPEWVEAHRDILTTTDYKAFLKQFEPESTAKRTPPKEYIRLLDLAESDPQQAQEEVRTLYGNDVIAKDVFTTVMSRARENEKQTGGRNFSSELRSYVSTSLTPERDAPQWQSARKLDALFQFDDFLEKNKGADRETLRKQAQSIVDDYKKIRYRQGATSLPMPRFTLRTPEALDVPELENAMTKTRGSLDAQMINEREAAEQAALIRRWMDIVKWRD